MKRSFYLFLVVLISGCSPDKGVNVVSCESFDALVSVSDAVSDVIAVSGSSVDFKIVDVVSGSKDEVGVCSGYLKLSGDSYQLLNVTLDLDKEMSKQTISVTDKKQTIDLYSHLLTSPTYSSEVSYPKFSLEKFLIRFNPLDNDNAVFRKSPNYTRAFDSYLESLKSYADSIYGQDFGIIDTPAKLLDLALKIQLDRLSAPKYSDKELFFKEKEEAFLSFQKLKEDKKKLDSMLNDILVAEQKLIDTESSYARRSQVVGGEHFSVDELVVERPNNDFVKGFTFKIKNLTDVIVSSIQYEGLIISGETVFAIPVQDLIVDSFAPGTSTYAELLFYRQSKSVDKQFLSLISSMNDYSSGVVFYPVSYTYKDSGDTYQENIVSIASIKRDLDALKTSYAEKNALYEIAKIKMEETISKPY